MAMIITIQKERERDPLPPLYQIIDLQPSPNSPSIFQGESSLWEGSRYCNILRTFLKFGQLFHPNLLPSPSIFLIYIIPLPSLSLFNLDLHLTSYLADLYYLSYGKNTLSFASNSNRFMGQFSGHSESLSHQYPSQ